MKLGTFRAFITGLYILMQLTSATAYIKFTNLKCANYDKSFLNIRKCGLKALSRNKVALTVDIQVFQLPVNNISGNLVVYRKANGYRPFMINITADFCQFMKNKKRIPFGKMIMDAVELYSNMNHSCPFNHDFTLRDFVLQPEQLQSLPVPTGEYLLRILARIYNVRKFKVDAYIQIVEE
ncbi:uncharacterized protein LOC126762378 [Bactrocera neohumeralis]|uniref:uncharacterized protein LOC126762378 n=1 Tax=Bactrocera neohumeralis TaxID=98809 RepID=UPI0021663E6D|nr:uncharacterized protein LOC126762378 [Bactrocera neohumeralis]